MKIAPGNEALITSYQKLLSDDKGFATEGDFGKNRHSGDVLSVSFSPDGEHILTGSSDQTAKLWDLSGKEIRTFSGHSGDV